MHRPLWQTILSVLLLSFAAHRAAASAIAWGSAVPREIAITTGCEAAAGVAAAIGLWIGGRPAVVGVILLGVAMAASAATMVFVLGAPAAPMAASRILIAALGAGAFTWMLRREPEPQRRGL